MSYFDIAIVVVAALLALIGLKKGAFKSLVGLFSWAVSFLVAFFVAKVVAEALLDVSALQKLVVGNSGSLYSLISGWFSKMDILNSTFLQKLFTPLFTNILSYGGVTGTANEMDVLALMIAFGIFTLIVAVAIFIIIRIIMALVSIFIKSFSSGKKPGGISRLIGFIIGAARGFICAAVVLLIFNFITFIPVLNVVGDQIEDSKIAKPIYTQVAKLSDKFFVKYDDDLIYKLISKGGFIDEEVKDIDDDIDIDDDVDFEIDPYETVNTNVTKKDNLISFSKITEFLNNGGISLSKSVA